MIQKVDVDFFTVKPLETSVRLNDDEFTLDVCDGYMAVLTIDQLTEWRDIFTTVVSDPEMPELVDFWSAMFIFAAKQDFFVIVADSGGEGVSGDFSVFCDEQSIPCQFKIDSIDVTGENQGDIYTGESNDDQYLLSLLWSVFNKCSI